MLANPHTGEVPLDRAIDRFHTSDVFMHIGDPARTTGQDYRLDLDTCAELLAGMESVEEVMRSSGQYGARVPVPADTDAQTKLLGFIGGDPSWTAPRRDSDAGGRTNLSHEVGQRDQRVAGHAAAIDDTSRRPRRPRSEPVDHALLPGHAIGFYRREQSARLVSGDRVQPLVVGRRR